MIERYTHLNGTEAKTRILEHKGLLPKDKETKNVLQPRTCPNPVCQAQNTFDSKSCIRCSFIFSFEERQRQRQEQEAKDRDVQELKEELNAMRSEMNDVLEVLNIAKSKDGMLGKDRTMLDEKGRVTFGYVDHNNQIVEVKIPLDGVEVDRVATSSE